MALVLALALAGCGGVGNAAAPTTDAAPRYTGPATAPAGDAFYTPPAILPAGRPGDLLWSRQVTAAGPLRGLGVAVYEVMYLSTDAQGARDAVSGVVMLPPPAARPTAPVVSFATGTHGMGDACAPSKAIAAGTDDWLDAFVIGAHQGWVVAATDYQGLGTPGDHTYTVGRSEGHAVIDAARAARRLRGAGVPGDTEVAFWGYSQGGGAATWAGELAPSYAPELKTVAVAAGGVPADLAAVSEALDGAQWAGVALMSALGLNAAYPELKLADYVRPEARASLDRLRTQCLKEALPEFAGKHFQDYLTVDPLQLPAWKARLTENSLGRTPPAVPIYLYHGGKDTVVAYGQAEALARTYCREGATVDWVPFPDDDHGAASYRTDGVVAFLASRFAGKPATSTC